MPEKIKIAHLIPSIGFGGGAENMLYNLARSIDASRFAMTVLYWGEHEDMVEPLRAAGADVVKLALNKVVSLDSVLKVARAVKDCRADILHTHFMDADWLGFWAARLAGVPMMLEVHSFPFPEFQRHAYRYRMMSWGVWRVVCVSATVKEHILRRTGICGDKFSVIHNGLDIGSFEARAARADHRGLRGEFGLAMDDIVIGNVSRLIPDKGHEYLIRAFPEVVKRYPRVKLLIIGDGPLRDELGRLAVGLGIEGKVVFAGKRSDIPELLGIMDIFVFPTFNEAFGICVLEAMAAAKPIIATNDAAIPEILEDGVSGLLIPPGRTEQVSGALLKILDDPLLGQSLAKNARSRVNDFSMKKMTDAYEVLYARRMGA